MKEEEKTKTEAPRAAAPQQPETEQQPGQPAAAEDAVADAAAAQPESEVRQELRRLVEEQAREDERPISSAGFTLVKIVGGEFLKGKFLRQQRWLILIIVGLTMIYISNRYSCDNQRILISNLTKELEEAKFRAMSSTSNLTEISRESNVLQMLQQNKDSVLHIPSQPPYIINVVEQ